MFIVVKLFTLDLFYSSGDPSRRPYPTDAEMRQGYMAKPYDKLRESLINQASQPGSHTPSASDNFQVGKLQ